MAPGFPEIDDRDVLAQLKSGWHFGAEWGE